MKPEDTPESCLDFVQRLAKAGIVQVLSMVPLFDEIEKRDARIRSEARESGIRGALEAVRALTDPVESDDANIGISIGLARAQQAIQMSLPKERWIRCTPETMPERGVLVHAFHPDYGVREGMLSATRDEVVGNWAGIGAATHWAPMLPAPGSEE